MTALALLCSIALSAAQCDRTTAVDSIPLGETATPMECALGAQATLAQLALRADAGHRWVIRCEPRHVSDRQISDMLHQHWAGFGVGLQ